MRTLAILFVLLVASIPAIAQERSGPKKAPSFQEAVDTAKKAVDADKPGAAIAALQAAIKDLQKKQRVAVLAALPKPAGFQVEDEVPDESADNITSGLIGVGSSTTRNYQKGDQRLTVEITANSPLLQMMTMVFNNPALIEADGGELVKYGAHKAILKKNGDDGQELSILMHDSHLIKVTSVGVGADDLLKIFDQAFVDRLEKPLGK